MLLSNEVANGYDGAAYERSAMTKKGQFQFLRVNVAQIQVRPLLLQPCTKESEVGKQGKQVRTSFT